MRSLPLSEAVASLMPVARHDLAELVALPSVAVDGSRAACERAAAWISRALDDIGFPEVSVLEMPDGWQSVYGVLPGPAGAPTVLLYAHFDVQPAGDEHAWDSPPFTLTERGGRWHGRGAADCKGAVVAHLTALRALQAAGGVPVTVKVLVEGSEEQGTGGLEQHARTHPHLTAADAVVVADAGNLRAGRPTITTTLRGITMVHVQVETLQRDLHSGQFGGPAPGALTALIALLASLTHDDGSVGVDGLADEGRWEGADYPEDDFRQDAGVLDGVRLTGTGTIADRLWARPSIAVMGIDCPSVDSATPTLHARARAAVALRVPPGLTAARAAELLTAHVHRHAPWNARVRVDPAGRGEPFQAATAGPAHRAMARALREAWDGHPVALAGFGGGVPLCNALADLHPDAEIVLIGLNDPAARIHAPNESVSTDELRRTALAEARFLRHYAAAHNH